MPTPAPKRRETQINPTGLSPEVINEFKKLCGNTKAHGKSLTQGQMFLRIFEEWKALKAQRPEDATLPPGMIAMNPSAIARLMREYFEAEKLLQIADKIKQVSGHGK
jgi:hypothetical protein